MPDFLRPQPARRPLPPAAIGAYREALLCASPPDERERLAASLDPEFVTWLDLFHAARQEPVRPEPAFVARLDRVIAQEPGPISAEPALESLRPLRLSRSHATNGHHPPTQSASPQRWPRLDPRLALQSLAMAAVLVVLIAGALFATLHPLLGRNAMLLPLFAPEVTPAPSQEAAAGTTLLELTLADIAPYRTRGGLGITRYPSGGSSRELAVQTAEVFTIAVGPMTLSVEEAPEPLRVLSPWAEGVAPTSRVLEAGASMTLETGATVVAPPGAIVTLVNEGPSPTTMLNLLRSGASRSTEAGGATRDWGHGARQELALPVSIALYQTTLVAGQTLLAPDASDTSQAAVAVDAERKLDLRTLTDGTVINASDEPIELYVLTVTNNVETTVRPNPNDPATSQLEFLWESTGGAEPIRSGYGVGVDPQGNIWVADYEDRFHILSPDGLELETWGTSGAEEGQFEFYSTYSVARGYGDVAFDADGNIYVADTGNTRIQKFAPDRTFLTAWGSEGRDDGQFLTPSGIVIGPDGTVYVSDEGRDDVQRFDRDGRFLGTIGEYGDEPGQFSNPAGVAVTASGEIYVADYGNFRVQHFAADGTFLNAWGTAGTESGQFNKPNGVAVDAQSRIYVADDFNNRLQVFTPDGQFLATIGEPGGDPENLNDPLGVEVGNDGVAYVSDRTSIQAFQLAVPGDQGMSATQ